MKEYKKIDLLRILSEQSSEIDELADWKEKKNWEPIYNQPQDTPGYEGSFKARGQEHKLGKAKGEHIGHKIIDKITNEEVYILYPCDSEIEEFKRKHQDILDAMKSEFGDIYIKKNPSIPCKEPRVTGNKPFDVYHLDTGEKRTLGRKVEFNYEISDTKYLKTYLIYPFVKEILGKEVNDHLEKCSIPRIKVNERAHLDNHSKFQNDTFTYQTLNFNSYRSVRDFFEAAIRRVQGQQLPEEKEYREHHLARQFNKIYAKWDKTTKSQDRWNGFTDIYNLEKYGESATTFDTCVTSLLTIEGHLVQGGITPKYSITATFKTEHGKNISESNSMKRMKLNKDYEIPISDEVELDVTDLTKKDAIANNEDVRKLLAEILTKLKAKILSIPVQDQLIKAKISRFQLTPEEKEEQMRRRQERLARLNQSPEGEEVQPQGEETPQEVEEEGFLGESIVQEVIRRIKK